MEGIEKKKGNQCPVAQQPPPTPTLRQKLILLMSQLMTRRSINYLGGEGGEGDQVLLPSLMQYPTCS